ncbi:EthD domain-containing protein [Novosphingobium sp. G106]|uniref:EthD domain-containing protein n=1 Tax=Novosphingobium sp. G106 TaxID=2849500 RepID=UPI001C2D90E1|nr:EthD domain-containing protein [Novosphingobium sp. G106]MBV1687835.1 EthD domain-containing protein [Novosphingobium sp. G106]
MIKMILLLSRKPGMSLEDFQDYYENRHVPLASSFEGPLIRYRRNYIVDRSVGLADCDCITEVWYDLDGNWRDHRDNIVSPEMAEIIAKDEAQFLDRAATRIVIVEERESAPDTLPGNRERTVAPDR